MHLCEQPVYGEKLYLRGQWHRGIFHGSNDVITGITILLYLHTGVSCKYKNPSNDIESFFESSAFDYWLEL